MIDERDRSDAARAAELYAFVIFAGRTGLKTLPDPNNFNPYYEPTRRRKRGCGEKDLRGMFPH